MALGIFLVLLLLLAAVDVKQLNFSSDEKGIVREKEKGEEILQRLKEQEASLRLLYSRLKKEIADLEAKQEALTRPTLALERKIQQIRQCIHKVLFLAAIMMLSLWE
ncbi:hypothetical protein HGM15179_014089 [Zosterops borbonicus]|uniref:Uncharacterized protein n=1 Tax=Zosterops borbonicus TaxID=364589 RepID=A0A8K1G6X0_9PASS|nr:hypothetical protein HGM15179_014089 [Zosterops borbonicus]